MIGCCCCMLLGGSSCPQKATRATVCSERGEPAGAAYSAVPRPGQACAMHGGIVRRSMGCGGPHSAVPWPGWVVAFGRGNTSHPGFILYTLYFVLLGVAIPPTQALYCR